MALLGAVVALLLFAGAAVWAWGVFLDRCEHDPGRVRAVMCLGVFGATALETALVAHGAVRSWVMWVSLLTNFWGALDAVLRFPAAHDLESFFSLKQLFLLLTKTFSFGLGMVSFKSHLWLLLFLLVSNIWMWPMLYFMALPMDEAEQVVKDDAYDVDVLIRVWQLAASATERQVCLASCRSWWYRRLALASERSSLARVAICATSARHRRALRKVGRNV